MNRSSFAINTLLAAQLAIGTASIGLLAFAPPAKGEMLLLPLRSGAPVARLARNGDAMLLARGPGDGLVVRGQRAALFWPLLRAGVLTLAAPRSWCGEVR
ncbi:hypothetical protein [Sphingomonas dokdonensis]|uniref:Uncharacterized protein n=1 Tax=Sphingomonas dokdonensis TaxID=344880 RepID=A0A245ZK96_9SPHN|nr:hypothetical protein [Sphingomonas dokdonensis]OWK30158.1 hypothetical protein SPDO_18400 [Sphingomonas dokdonensis]